MQSQREMVITQLMQISLNYFWLISKYCGNNTLVVRKNAGYKCYLELLQMFR